MKSIRTKLSVLFVCSVVLLSLSCGGGGGRSKPTDEFPGIATLLVTVRAEAKTGWQDPRKQSDYAGLRPGEAKSFETTDYSNIDDIIVWVEPQADRYAATAGNISIDLGDPQQGLRAAGVGSIWDFRNATGKAIDVFLRTESGKVVPLGLIPGPGRSLTPDVQGYVEVMAVDQSEPLARVFVAPTAFVRVATTREPVRFFAVPPGRAKIITWHPRLPGTTTEVNVSSNGETRATVTIGVNSLPKVP